MMNLDLNKLLRWLLITFLRAGQADIIRAIASVFVNLYSQIKIWYIDIQLQSSITCQVMYLELILNYRLLGTTTRKIYIDNAFGEYDFTVNVPENTDVDSQRLIAFIEKYKMVGKRYNIATSAYTYTYNWTSYINEQIQKKQNTARLFKESTGLYVMFYEPIQAKRVRVTVEIDNYSTIYNHTFTIEQGDQVSYSYLDPLTGSEFTYKLLSVDVNPDTADDYVYDGSIVYVNSGFKRAKQLSVTIKKNNVQTAVLSLPFSEAFTAYESVNDLELSRMLLNEYNARLSAYRNYINNNYQSQYPGVDIDTINARIEL